MSEKDLINYAKNLLNNTVTLDEKTISELAYEEIKSKKSLLKDIFLRFKNQDKKAFFLAGGAGAGKTELASGLNKLYQIDTIEADEIRKHCKYYNGKNSHLFQRASSKGVSILMDTVLSKGLSFILDGNFSEYRLQNENISRALKKNYDVEINFVYRPLLIAKEYTEIREEKEGRRILDDTFYSKFISSITTVNKIKDKYPLIKINFYDLHNDLVFKDINSLDEIINQSEVMQNDIKFAKDFLIELNSGEARKLLNEAKITSIDKDLS